MNNLGLYYHTKCDFDLMTKYYLMAIELGNSATMYNLGLYYKKINNQDLMIKYHLMGACVGNTDCIASVNKYLEQKPNIRLMESAYSFLTPANKRLLNETIMDVVNITYHNVFAEKICIIWQELGRCVFLTYGHPICNKCFILSDNMCSLCG
jgi:hypothetical protein